MFCIISYISELLIKIELLQRLVIPQKGTVLCCTKVKTRLLIVNSNYAKTVLYGNDKVKCHQQKLFRLVLVTQWHLLKGQLLDININNLLLDIFRTTK